MIMAVYGVFLSQVSQEPDILFGVPVSARQQNIKLNDAIGLFVNTLALRSIVPPEIEFGAFVKKQSAEFMRVLDHVNLPFDILLKHIDFKRELSRSPVVQVMLAFEQIDGINWGYADSLDQVEQQGMKTMFDLTLFVSCAGDEYVLTWEYSTDLFTPATIERFGKRFEHLLLYAVENIDTRISMLPYADDNELRLVKDTFNATNKYFPVNETVQSLIFRKSLSCPDAVAIRHNDTEISYQQLLSKSLHLSNLLIDKFSVCRDKRVGVLLNRDPSILICILGVLFAGGAYVPIEATFPSSRVKYILDDSTACALLTTNALTNKWSGAIPEEKVVCIENIFENPINETQNMGLEDIRLRTDSSGLAYVMYTSGTTVSLRTLFKLLNTILNTILTFFMFYSYRVNRKVS
jgi:non-ribosomal peptide synthetase component F